MTPIAQRIFDYLDDFMPQYKNPHGVAFTLNCDNSVYVAFGWDDKLNNQCLEFGICYSNDDFTCFLNDFQITSLHHLKALTKEKLWELYYLGKAEVYCSMGAYFYNNFELHFCSKENRIIAKIDGGEGGHEVHELLKTPRQFMQYTYACLYTKTD